MRIRQEYLINIGIEKKYLKKLFNKQTKNKPTTKEENLEFENLINWCKKMSAGNSHGREFELITKTGKIKNRKTQSTTIRKILNKKHEVVYRYLYLDELDKKLTYISKHLTHTALTYYFNIGDGSAAALKTKFHTKYMAHILDKHAKKINLIYPLIENSKVYTASSIMEMFGAKVKGKTYDYGVAKYNKNNNKTT